MPRTRLNTWPNTTSHRIGCTAREKSSVGSRRSLCNSALATAAVCRANVIMELAEAASRIARLAHIDVAPAFLDGSATVMREHIVECCVGTQRSFELGGLAAHRDNALVQDGELSAQRIG